MKRSTTSSTQQSTSPRCTYTASSGGRCRMLASPDSPYCRSHAKNSIVVASTLAAELSQAAGSLGTPEDVNRVLAKIFLALAADRLSTRKAAVLGYIGQMLLRSHREIAFHKKLAEEEANRNDSGHRVVIDIPGMTDEAPTPAVPAPQPTPAPQQTPEVADPSQPYPPLADLNHFYPRDPSLPPSLQQPRNTTSPPDEDEQRWHELSRRYAPPRRRM